MMRHKTYAMNIDIRPIIIPVVVVKEIPQLIVAATEIIFSMLCFIQ
ncbi:hypothetical protein [Marinilabilia salmonicolor]|nr:hypothetical protein [Marinilabilia salmonicolor]